MKYTCVLKINTTDELTGEVVTFVSLMVANGLVLASGNHKPRKKMMVRRPMQALRQLLVQRPPITTK
jgi:hypothetical protein